MIKYAGVGFVVGVVLSIRIPIIFSDIKVAAELAGRSAAEDALTYVTRAGALQIEIAGKEAVAAAVSQLEMLTFVVKALESLPWALAGTLGAADLLFSSLMAAGGNSYDEQIKKVKVRVETHNQQPTQ